MGSARERALDQLDEWLDPATRPSLGGSPSERTAAALERIAEAQENQAIIAAAVLLETERVEHRQRKTLRRKLVERYPILSNR